MPVDLETPRDRIHASIARRSLSWFFRLSWRLLEPATPLVWNWHLDAICEHVQALLEGRIPLRNLVINVPPGSSKSRIVSVCTTAWWWIDHPEWRGIYSSANPRNVIRDSIYCRQIIQSDWYQSWFTPRWKITGDQNAKSLYRNTAGGFRQAIGSGAAVTGDRANALFMDDMLDAKKAESRAEREKFHLFYDQGFANRVSDMRTGTRCMIAQRLHEADPVGHILKSGDWESLIIPQEYELLGGETPGTPKRHRPATSIGWSDPRTVEGDLMDPVRFPAVELAKEKLRLGTRGYASQHQQRPAPAGGTIILRVWLRWYKTPRDAAGNKLPPLLRVPALGITRVVQGVDTALSETTAADFTANATLGHAPNRIYMLDLFKDKMAAPASKAMIIAQQAKWNASAVVVEGGSSASGKAIAQTVKDDTTLPVIEMPVMGDKVVGLNAVAPTIEAGVVYLPEDEPWVMDFVESLVTFPTALNDDDVDAFRIALAYLIFGGGGMGLLEHLRTMASAQTAQPDETPLPEIRELEGGAETPWGGWGGA